MNIITDRLIIRNFKESDGQSLYEYLSDEDVVLYEPYGVFTESQAKEEARLRSIDNAFYAVCLRGNKKLIGNLFLEKGDYDSWELGFVFNKSYQGMGYGYESAEALIDFAFNKLHARRIIAMCNPKNKPSWTLLERLDMRREGTLLQNIYFKKDEEGNPLWCDTFEYAILKDEWNNNHI